MSITTESVPQMIDGTCENFLRRFYPRCNNPNVQFSHASFQFNQAAVNALDQADSISVFINEAERMLIVRPAAENIASGSRWTYTAGTQIRPRTIAYASFMKTLYEAMGWFPEYDYRAAGASVQTHHGPMLLFWLDDTEMIARQSAPLRQ